MKFKKTLSLGLTALSLSGCNPDAKRQGEKIEIEVGCVFGVNEYFILYNGMNNEDTFSMSGWDHAAVNVFYPILTDEFQLYNQRFKLEGVTPKKINLTYLGRNRIKRENNKN